jgi:heptaprenyl diphosphate synthase
VATPSPLLDIPGLSTGLTRVEDRLTQSVHADDPFLTELASHLIRAGGKRVRPGFTLAAAAAGGAMGEDPTDEAVQGGVAVELVHLGSLYHDDVMDDAATRRTVESVNARWGNLKAILAGDFLLAKASELAAGLGVEVAALLAATIGRLCEGQVRELKDVYNVGRTEDDYLASISGKTASLFATACKIGGLVTHLDDDGVAALTDFGFRYGMAFQIVDDVLDVVATDEQLGKPSGNDLVEGVYTLPVIRALTSTDGDALRAVLGRPLGPDERDISRDIVRANGAVDEAMVVARGYVRAAVDALDVLPPSAATSGLAAAAEGLVANAPTPV